MKKYISLFAIALLFSCSQDDLAQLKSKRTSLKAEISKAKGDLLDVEDKIKGIEGEEKKIYEVTTQSLSSSTFKHFFEVQGVVEADKVINVNPEATGSIRTIQVSEGQRVQAGHVLATLDSEILTNGIKELEVSLKLAKILFEKQERLYKQNIGSEIQYLQSKSNYDGLVSKIETMKSQEDLYVVKAPFAGIVDEIFPKVGELAMPQGTILRLVNLDKVKVESEISEKYIPIIKKGTLVDVKFPSLEKNMECTISRTGEFINPSNRSYKIQIALENYNNDLKPNMIATLLIKDFEQKNAVTIPSNSIQQDHEGNEYVYVAVKKGSQVFVEKRTIETGLSYDNAMYVKSGLKTGDQLIMKGARNIQDGQEISVRTKKA